MENLSTDWSEFLGLLISRRAEFLVVGGHALSVHGKPRFTEDLDVWINATEQNADRVIDALVAFGFGDVAPTREELAAPDKVFMLGRRPYRIDILTSISGVTFDEAWPTRVLVEFDPGPIAVIGRDSFIRNKRAAARPKDLADLALLGVL